MPVEIIQRNIGLICNICDVVAHIIASIHGIIAGFRNVCLDNCRIIVHLDTDHITLNFELHFCFLRIELEKRAVLWIRAQSTVPAAAD